MFGPRSSFHLFISLTIVLAAIDSTKAESCNSTNIFTCADGSCISSTLICDGAFDCNDNSDEINCTSEGCIEGQHKCPGGSCETNVENCPTTTTTPTESTSEQETSSGIDVVTSQLTTTNGIKATVTTESEETQPQNNVQTTEGPVNMTNTSPSPTKTNIIPGETDKKLYLLFLLLIPLIAAVGALLWRYRKDIKYYIERGHEKENIKVKYEHE